MLRKLWIFFATLGLIFYAHNEANAGDNYIEKSYSTSTVTVTTSFDYANQVDYKFTGYNLGAYSKATVCLRRVKKDGYTKSYDEILDTRDNPTTTHNYHTYKKIRSDESGVKVHWLELTEKNSGKTIRYINYK